MRIAARVEPTQHVIRMVRFAEAVLREARDAGLRTIIRRKRHRRKKKAKANTGNSHAKKGGKKGNPLAGVEE